MLHHFIARTHKEFTIKDLSKLNYFLGLDVSYTSTDIFVGQSKYARDILDHAKVLDSKPVATPFATGEVLVSLVPLSMIQPCTVLWLVPLLCCQFGQPVLACSY